MRRERDGLHASREADLGAPRRSPRRARARSRLRQRRGAITVLVGAIFVMLMGIAAMAIDFSRLWSLRNELETSADAAALAGAIQLVPPNVVSEASDSARAYALSNKAMGGTVTVESVELGVWDDPTSTFTVVGPPPHDAVRVVVSRPSNGLIMSFFGIVPPTLRARAVAWSDAPVTTSTCIKPWAIPYPVLRAIINPARGLPNTPANLVRPFDNVADMVALRALSSAARTFRLKLNDGNLAEAVPTIATMPDRYQPLALPKSWDAFTGLPASPGPVVNINDYEENVSGATCHGLSVGDTLVTIADGGSGIPLGALETATINGAGPGGNPGGICTSMTLFLGSPNHGNCFNGATQGVDLKAVFYVCPAGCTGTKVGIELLGSFTLMKVSPSPANPTWTPAEIQGIFKPMVDNGPVGTSGSTIRRPILVR